MDRPLGQKPGEVKQGVDGQLREHDSFLDDEPDVAEIYDAAGEDE